MSSALYQILHDTHYRYSAPVSLAQQLAHLWPRDCPWQRCHERELRIAPQPCQRRDGLDVFGNPLTRLVFERPHQALSIGARLHVEGRVVRVENGAAGSSIALSTDELRFGEPSGLAVADEPG